MSDWHYLNQWRIMNGPFASRVQDGFNGAFSFPMAGESRRVFCIASDSLGWQHVSVSFGGVSHKIPSWELMCRVKDLFWEPEDVVVQFHPKRSQWVNNHPGCLHLWRCTDGREFPTPDPIMVGVKT